MTTRTADSHQHGDLAIEIELSDGGNLFFIAGDRGFFMRRFCACGITDNAGPELKNWIGAEMENLGLPLFSIPAGKATDGVAELTRLFEKGGLMKTERPAQWQ